MKKVFTLVAAIGLFLAADAQPMRHRTAPVQVTIASHNPGFAADYRLRAELNRINNKYDRKVDQVRRSFFMRPAVKASKVRSLERQRQREIDKAFRKFGRNSRYDYPNRRY